jgi:hypothetical protein
MLASSLYTVRAGAFDGGLVIESDIEVSTFCDGSLPSGTVYSSRTRSRPFCRKHNSESSVVEAVKVAVQSESHKPETQHV